MKALCKTTLNFRASSNLWYSPNLLDRLHNILLSLRLDLVVLNSPASDTASCMQQFYPASPAFQEELSSSSLQFWSSTSSITTHHHLISESSSQFTPPKLRDLFVPHKKAFLRYLVKIEKRLGKDLFLMLPLRCGTNYQNTLSLPNLLLSLKRTSKPILFCCSFETM